MSSELSRSPRPDSLLVSLPRTLVPQLGDPVAQARAELKAALAAIEEKANIPKRAARATDKFVHRARIFAKTKPAQAAVMAVGVAAVVGLAVWGGVRLYTAPRR
jgi:negative regulator of sigma E activity